jgi:hypothetical protein
MMKLATAMFLLMAGVGLAGSALAALPPPSPAQAQAAAAKKADADAKAAQEKERLAASMDSVSTRWRQRAASEGYRIVPPQLAAAAPMTPMAASDVTPPGAGIPAAAPANAAPGTAAAAPATGAAPRSVQALRSATMPVKSEKLGTARPSADVKRGPTPSLPAGAAPTVDKKGVPDDASKQ